MEFNAALLRLAGTTGMCVFLVLVFLGISFRVSILCLILSSSFIYSRRLIQFLGKIQHYNVFISVVIRSAISVEIGL